VKNRFAMTLLAPSLALPLLCGCNQKQDADLKARVEKLEAQQELTARSLNDLFTLSKSYQKKNQEMLNDLQGAVFSQGANMSNVGMVFLDHLTDSALHSWPKPGAVRAGTPLENQRTKPLQTRDGVPLDVYNTIAVQAIKKWPWNYQKQQSYITEEVKHYKKMHP